MRAPKKLEVHVFHHAGRPGIGAVVAMVASARMVRPFTRVGVGRQYRHWDGVPFPWHFSHPACHGDGITTHISNVDCPDCLRMHAMVYGGAK